MCDPGLIINEIFKTIVVKRLEIIMDKRSWQHLPNVRSVHKHNSRVEFTVSMNKICKGRILDSSLVRIIQELCMITFKFSPISPPPPPPTPPPPPLWTSV
jgi:hypothetical protein